MTEGALDHQRIILAGLAALDRKAISQSIEALVGLLDLIDGDPDLEAIDEREPDGEEGGHAWIERLDQSAPPYPIHDCAADYRNGEDAEDDDPDHGADEGEPFFRDPLSRRGSGPGCVISDSDFGGEEAGEADGL